MTTLKEMASRKILKSVSHNFGHSFISALNYNTDDYFLGHLLKQARKTNINRLEVNILERVGKPEKLLTNSIRQSIAYCTDWFPELVKSSGSAMEYIQFATVAIEFDLARTRPYLIEGKLFIESLFYCEVIIIDDRGKKYFKRHTGWWFPET